MSNKANVSSLFYFVNVSELIFSKVQFFIRKRATQPAKLQKKQCGGVYFCVNGIAFSMPIQQKLPPPVLLFSDFAGWERMKTLANLFAEMFN